MTPTALTTYGTLRPGRCNHDQLAGLRGDWVNGQVRGHLYPEGWGAALGYPGLILDPVAEPVEVDVLVSDDLDHHWARLDDFEGEGYARVITTVETERGALDAWVYVLVADPSSV